MTSGFAGGARGDNNQWKTRINEGKGLDYTTMQHETAHQLLLRPGNQEHALTQTSFRY